jgi:hypothetical protein
MDESTRNDIRRLLKTFGVQADKALTAHLERNPDQKLLRVRLLLEDVTDYGDAPPEESLSVEIEGEVRQ